MKIKDINIGEWQELLMKFKSDIKFTGCAAMRIENTQFTAARYYGGMTFNGEHYTYFEPIVPGEKNDDGSQKFAWLMVRADFLKWANKQLNKEDKG